MYLFKLFVFGCLTWLGLPVGGWCEVCVCVLVVSDLNAVCYAVGGFVRVSTDLWISFCFGFLI